MQIKGVNIGGLMGISLNNKCIHPLLKIQDEYIYIPRVVEIDDSVYDSSLFPELSLLLLIAARKCYNQAKVIEFFESIFSSNYLYKRIIQKIADSDVYKIKVNGIPYFEFIGDLNLLSRYIQKKQGYITVFLFAY